jgi:SAM-dependent methyltransferase
VYHADVLDLPRPDARATIVADLADAGHVPADTFDCIIFTQTLQYIFNLEAAIATLHRILRPGGVLLGTFPAISQICRFDMDRWGDYWRFTSASIHRLLAAAFRPEHLIVTAHGNVLAAIAFLHGLAAEELTVAELDYQDPDYELLLTARAVKAGRSP